MVRERLTVGTNSRKPDEITGCIFDIQRYCIHDGPGIRTTVFFKGCSLNCYWCQNPESQTKSPQVFFFREKCSQCGICIQLCPHEAVSKTATGIAIDRDVCVGCGLCAQQCPNEARKLTGVLMTPDEVFNEIIKDRNYYRNSNGGVTLSGGEALLQGAFVLNLLKKCRGAGIHTAVETCGHVPWSVFEQILPYIDLVLYDIKHLDPKLHKDGTGASNANILENARKVAKQRPMRVRVPLIPGFNDTLDQVSAIARFVKSEMPSVEIDLIGYNKMGEGKYGQLDRTAIALEMQDENYLQTLREAVARILL